MREAGASRDGTQTKQVHERTRSNDHSKGIYRQKRGRAMITLDNKLTKHEVGNTKYIAMNKRTRWAPGCGSLVAPQIWRGT